MQGEYRTNYRETDHAVQYGIDQDYRNNAIQPEYRVQSGENLRYAQSSEPVSNTYASQDQDDMNYVPDVVKRSYQSLAAPREEQPTQLENSYSTNYEVILHSRFALSRL